MVDHDVMVQLDFDQIFDVLDYFQNHSRINYNAKNSL